MSTPSLLDVELFDKIYLEVPVFSDFSSFSEALEKDPRRIDARVQQSLIHSILPILHPSGGTAYYKEEMQSAYLQRLESLRKIGGHLNACVFEDDYLATFQILVERVKILTNPNYVDRMGLGSLYYVNAICENTAIIDRELTEAMQVLLYASRTDRSEACRFAWGSMASAMKQFKDYLVRFCEASKNQEESYGQEWRQYILSGHRAPDVSLPQYRRMGGRFY